MIRCVFLCARTLQGILGMDWKENANVPGITQKLFNPMVQV